MARVPLCLEALVLQRNAQPYPLSVPSLSLDVEPGDVIDHPDPIAGFEPVDELASEPPADVKEVDAETKPDETKKTTKKADASPASIKEA